MSSELEDRLRDSMDHFTQDVSVPEGLLRRAHRHVRRRRGVMSAVAVGGVATAVTAVSIVASHAHDDTAPRTENVGYVIHHVEQALADNTDTISYVRKQFPANTVITHGTEVGILVTGSAPLPGRVSTPPPYEERWTYGDRYADVLVSGSGDTASESLTTSPSGRPASMLMVNYALRTWYRTMVGPSETPAPQPTTCTQNVWSMLWDAGNSSAGSSDISTLVRQGLSCGAYTIAGHHHVNGVDAIELVTNTDRGKATVWIDTATDLPVRITGPEFDQIDLTWLPPTTANLAHLELNVPPGFTERQPTLPSSVPSDGDSSGPSGSTMSSTPAAVPAP